MKKCLVFILCLMFAVSFVACGGGNKPKNNPNSDRIPTVLADQTSSSQKPSDSDELSPQKPSDSDGLSPQKSSGSDSGGPADVGIGSKDSPLVSPPADPNPIKNVSFLQIKIGDIIEIENWSELLEKKEKELTFIINNNKQRAKFTLKFNISAKIGTCNSRPLLLSHRYPPLLYLHIPQAHTFFPLPKSPSGRWKCSSPTSWTAAA